MPSVPTPVGSSPSCTALIALLALLTLLSGVLLWLVLTRTCVDGARDGGDNPTKSPFPKSQDTPKRGGCHNMASPDTQGDVTTWRPLHVTAAWCSGDRNASAPPFQPLGAIYVPIKGEAAEDGDTEMTQLVKEEDAAP